MGQAKIAAQATDHYLRTGRNPDPPPPEEKKKAKAEKATWESDFASARCVFEDFV